DAVDLAADREHDDQRGALAVEFIAQPGQLPRPDDRQPGHDLTLDPQRPAPVLDIRVDGYRGEPFHVQLDAARVDLGELIRHDAQHDLLVAHVCPSRPGPSRPYYVTVSQLLAGFYHLEPPISGFRCEPC